MTVGRNGRIQENLGARCGFFGGSFMRTIIAAVVFFFSLAVQAQSPEPEMGNVLRVMGRFGVAHACPISPTMALTNAHVVDLRPFDNTPLYGARYQNIRGDGYGMAEGMIVSINEDLALMMLKPSTTGFYQIATEPPKLGETLYWMAYDWRKGKTAFAPRRMSGQVVAVVTGNIVMNTDTPEGASGSCLLNSHDEVVGIVAWGKDVGVDDEVTIAIGVWGPWRKSAQSLQARVEEALDKRKAETVESRP